MLEFRFHIIDESVKNFLKEGDPALINRIEGRLDIYWNNVLFFSDENTSLLELGMQLEHWMIRNQSGKIRDFHYHCVDWEDDDGFILEFLTMDSGLWEVDSVWRKIDKPHMSLDELIKATADFINRLKEQLIQRYSVDWDACLRYEMRNSIVLMRGE